MLSRIQLPVDYAIRIIQIAKGHAMRRADRNTCGLESVFDAVNAERALVRISVRVNEPRIVRTRRNTRFAADAFGSIDQHDRPELFDMTGAGGTALYTRRIVAMVTPLASDFHLERRELAC